MRQLHGYKVYCRAAGDAKNAAGIVPANGQKILSGAADCEVSGNRDLPKGESDRLRRVEER